MTDPARATAMAAAAEPRARTLDGLVRQLHRIAVPTTNAAASVERLLHDLEKRRPTAVAEIARFLRGGDDVDLVKLGAADAVGHRTLRQAVLDVLGTIGGADAAAVALEQLPRSADPTELVLLAHILDAQGPGLHRERVIQAADDLLQQAAHAMPNASPDVAPLFDLLRSYGGGDAVALLERSARDWPAYAFIALASVPDGAGIPSLVAFAVDADPTTVEPRLTYRVLAQASVQYPDAGDALVELAHAGWISDDAWGAIADALAGRRLQFSPTMPSSAPLAEPSATRRIYYVEWLNMRYEDDVASGSWSTTQVDAQVALLERLGDVASSPAAVRALRQARAALDRLRDGDAAAIPQS